MRHTAAEPGAPEMLDVRVHAVRAEALDVLSIELRAAAGGPLPRFTAGSHIDVEVPTTAPGGPLLRQYSLSNDSAEADRYVIGVGRDPASRGGSVALHDGMRPGSRLRISAPRNHFALVEDAPHSVLIAGGIGITPMLAMARRLAAIGARWTLYYCVRTPARAAFIEPLIALTPAGGPGRLQTVFDGVPGAARLDLAQVARDAPSGSHFYCCGPAPMLQAFVQATEGCDDARVHVEWFAAPAVPATAAAVAAEAGTFLVKLQRSGRQFRVPPGDSILSVLLANDIDVDHSCREGLCGTCETRVLSGVPLHCDPILSGKKSPPTDRIMVCVSRCSGAELVLDL